jgi:hypothetical protein
LWYGVVFAIYGLTLGLLFAFAARRLGPSGSG